MDSQSVVEIHVSGSTPHLHHAVDICVLILPLHQELVVVVLVVPISDPEMGRG